MLYELRIYYAMPGRLLDLHRRFENVVLPMWKEREIHPVGFWTVTVGPHSRALYYLLQWKDMAERERKFDAFRSDPEWIREREETERNGPLVEHTENMFLQPTSYSNLK
jgi:hypothetical protein